MAYVRYAYFRPPMQPSHVATAILNWNGKNWLEQFLPSVLSTRYPRHSVVLIDNGSTDDSVEFVRNNYPNIMVVVNEGNLGFAGGYNEGLREVQADYYAILNSDVEVDANWLQPLVDLLDSNPQIAACQPKVLSFAQPDSFEYAGASGGFIDRYGFPFCRGRVFETCEHDHGQYNDARPVFWATGAALFIRSGLFHYHGGFDKDFFAHMEEIDLCWRLQNAGHEIWVQPRSVVYHVGGGTLGKENPRKTYLNFRNNLIMMTKNLPLCQVFTRIPLRMGIDGQAALKELFGGNWGFFKAIFTAHMHFYASLPSTLAKRRQGKRKRKFHGLAGVYARSVVLWYYARAKRTFLQLPNHP